MTDLTTRRRRPHRRRSSLMATVSAAALLCAVVGCTTRPAAPSNKAYRVEPRAPMPNLLLDWVQEVNPRTVWDYQPQEYASPFYVRASDTLIVASSNGEVVRIDAGSGEVVEIREEVGDRIITTPWRRDLERPIHASPTVAEGKVFVGTLEATIHALQLDDAKILWQGRVDDAIEAQPVVADGRLFFSDASEVFYALDASSGEILWRYQREAPEYFLIKGTGVPTIVGDTVLVGSADGRMVALQIDTGEELWVTDLTGGAIEFVDADLAPIVEGDRVYAASYAGGLFALDITDGTVLWHRPLAGVSDMRLRKGVLYVASAQGRVAAFDASNGEPAWSYRFRKRSPVKAVPLNDEYLAVSTSSGPLTLLDMATGYPLLEWDPSNGFNTETVIGRGRAFLFSNGGHLYGFRLIR